MKTLTSFLLFSLLSPFAHAGMDMTPGLWNMVATTKINGEKVDPLAQMKKAMASASPEQRKKMEAMFGKMGGKGPGVPICYSKKQIESDKAFKYSKGEGCTMDFTTHTSKKIAGTYKCKDGVTGTTEWALSDTKNYKGWVRNKTGEVNVDISYVGKFVSADCGDVKPIE